MRAEEQGKLPESGELASGALERGDATTRPQRAMPPATAEVDPFPGASVMAALMRAKDWRMTPLGGIEGWPQSLRTAVSICLASRFPILVWWGEGMVKLYNDAYAPMLGAKHPWALGARGRDVWPEIWDIIGPMLDAVLHRGESTWSDDQMLPLYRHGFVEECYFTFSYSPIHDETGGVGGVFTAVTETTARVIATRRLVTLQRLSECAVGTWRSVADVCRAAAEVLARNPADVPFALFYLLPDDEGMAPRLIDSAGVAESVVRQQSEGDRAAARPFADAIAAAVRTRAPQRVTDLAFMEGAATGPWLEGPREAVALPVMRAGQDRAYGVLVAGLSSRLAYDHEYEGFLLLVAGQVATALASARAHEEERQRAEALAELDRAKTTFFSNISHEHRTPLSLVIGNIEQLLAGVVGTLTAAQRAALEMAQRNAYRLLKLTNALLDFSRIEAGHMEGAFEPVDLAALTADIAANFRSAIEQAKLRFVVDCQPLPDGARVFLDREMWEKIVLNLLSNALKHTFEGEIVIEVRCSHRSAILRVRDTGVGIAAEELPHVFDRFHRVPNARSRTHEGAGIGLALVRELVKLHRGAIEVESAVGAGTTFTVTIPVGSAHLPAERIRRTPTEGGAVAASRTTPAYVEEALRWIPSIDGDQAAVPATRSGRVLVADDNADMREYVARLLLERGWTVKVAADGRQALRLAKERQPDVIVSDVMMPGLDGFELIRELSADPATQGIPVIFLSARAGEGARIDGLEAGAADYLVKPFSARELLARVDAQLSRSLHRAEERRAREEQRVRLAIVEEERARLRTLFAEAPAAIAVLSGPDHVFEIANTAYLELVGNRPILGKPVREALSQVEGEGIFERLDDVYRRGEPFVGQAVPLLHHVSDSKAMDERFYNFVYQPIPDHQGRTTAIFVHAVDVTDQVRARQEAEEANRAKGDFLAAMSHELRTPLNAIDGYAQLLELAVPGPVNDAQRDVITRLRKSSHKLLGLVNDVLQFAKIEAGRIEFHLERVRVANSIAAIAPMIEVQVASRQLSYHTHADARLEALADQDRLEQILLNLVSNAIKFTPPGGRITISAAESRIGERPVVCIDVADTGVGIPADKLTSIFDPFVQANRSLARPVPGTGLGLAISRDLAHGMDGELTVMSAEGGGSVFRLTLPAATEQGGGAKA